MSGPEILDMSSPGFGPGTDFLEADHRATSIKEAILAHDGEAADAVRGFRRLSEPEQGALLDFLSAL